MSDRSYQSQKRALKEARLKDNYDKEKRRKKWGGGPFIALSRPFLNSYLLKILSPLATRLLFNLLSQYNGMNNGDLTLAWSVMENYGWSGRSTLEKARKQLMECGLLLLSRQGGKHKPSLYALSLFSIDECNGKLEELKPTEAPPNDWLKAEIKLRSEAQSSRDKAKQNPCPVSRVKKVLAVPPPGLKPH
jgi:hypothetical protein